MNGHIAVNKSLVAVSGRVRERKESFLNSSYYYLGTYIVSGTRLSVFCVLSSSSQQTHEVKSVI